jgi:type IV pilus assembly protein PilC
MATATFEYRVRDPLGKVHQGQVQAADADDATQQLRQDGFAVLDLAEAGDDAPLVPRPVGRSRLVYVTSQLAIMVDTGVSLSEALESALAQEEHPTLRRVLRELKGSVEEGEDFSAALARYPRLFDPTYIALVKAAEATGSLGAMLDRVARFLRKELETRSKVRAALAYPTVMLVLAVSVTVFLLTYVLPKFTPLFARRGMNLPTPTRVMMALSTALLDYWPWWLAGAVVAIVGFLFGRRTAVGRRALDAVKLHLPVLGTMFRKVAISRSLRTLATVLRGGVPLLEALRLVGEVAGNSLYRDLWQQVAEQVTTGESVHASLASSPLFPRMLAQMISAGENTGKLDVVLERISDYYDQEVETSLKTVTSLLEPLMITAMGFVVGGIGLALMLPIFQLSRPAG